MSHLGQVLIVVDDRTPKIADVATHVAGLLSNRANAVTTIGLADFHPAMTTDERRAYETDAPITSERIERSAEAVRAAQSLIFIHPTPSNGLSAPIKGWIDRVLVPGVAFVLDERTGRVKPALGHISHLGLISVDDRTRLQRFLEHDNARRVIFRALRLVCGVRTRTHAIALRSADLSNPALLNQRLARVATW